MKRRLDEELKTIKVWDEKVICDTYDRVCAPDFCYGDVEYVLFRIEYETLIHLYEIAPKESETAMYMKFVAMPLAYSAT